jgi:hypothetical protein
MAMALVDAFLIPRKLLSRWKLVDESESSFFRFLRELLPTVADAAEAIDRGASSAFQMQSNPNWKRNC